MNRQQVRAFDRWAIEKAGIPGVVLMENAGRGAAQIILSGLPESEASVCIFCGSGNNGGDGYVIARHLANAGVSVQVVLCAPREKIGGDADMNLRIIQNLGLEVEMLPGDDVEPKIREWTQDADLIVDALFGTGLTGPLRPDAANLVKMLNESDTPIMAVDIPSGLDCDTGTAQGVAIRAAFTVTFAARKTGFDNPDSTEFTGEVFTVDIGISPDFYLES